MDYIELTVNIVPKDPWSEILITELAESGYESFVETETGIQAFGQVTLVNGEDPIFNTFLNLFNLISIFYNFINLLSRLN